MKKKQLLYALPLSAVLLLGACGDKDTDKEETTTTTEKTTDESTGTTETTQDTDATETNSIDTNIPFKEFKIEIEYPKGEYELKYDKEYEKEKAKLKDDREAKNKDLEGEDALADYQSTLEKFTFDSSATDEDVKKQLLEYMDIDDDYDKIKLKVKFDDDKEKEYTFTK